MILVQQLEGHILQPVIQGKLVAIHPLAVVLAVAGGSIVAGLVGAVIAVPIVAVANVLVRYTAQASRGQSSTRSTSRWRTTQIRSRPQPAKRGRGCGTMSRATRLDAHGIGIGEHPPVDVGHPTRWEGLVVGQHLGRGAAGVNWSKSTATKPMFSSSMTMGYTLGCSPEPVPGIAHRIAAPASTRRVYCIPCPGRLQPGVGATPPLDGGQDYGSTRHDSLPPAARQLHRAPVAR